MVLPKAYGIIDFLGIGRGADFSLQVLPVGWNTIPYFDKFTNDDLPPVSGYNYSMTRKFYVL